MLLLYQNLIDFIMVLEILWSIRSQRLLTLICDRFSLRVAFALVFDRYQIVLLLLLILHLRTPSVRFLLIVIIPLNLHFSLLNLPSRFNRVLALPTLLAFMTDILHLILGISWKFIRVIFNIGVLLERCCHLFEVLGWVRILI